jgi:hypothetical protein
MVACQVKDFQPVFLSDLNDARDVLLLLRAERRDFLARATTPLDTAVEAKVEKFCNAQQPT